MTQLTNDASEFLDLYFKKRDDSRNKGLTCKKCCADNKLSGKTKCNTERCPLNDTTN